MKEEKGENDAERKGEGGARSSFTTHRSPLSDPSVETLLVQQIIRYGDVVIMEGLETEDGNRVNLNVAQYIDFEFSSDGLSFSNDLFNRILHEAVEHSMEKEFKAETYFTQHPDVEVSQLATRLAIDNYQLGRSFELNPTERDVRQQVEHLILDFRYILVSDRIKELKNELKTHPDLFSSQEFKEEFMMMNEIYQQLGRKLGR